jgi:5-methyltetrahydrofolate--homocysteine methyltransferase
MSDCTTLLLELLSRRILVLDGAMGTMLQRHRLTEADFRGDRFVDHDHELRGNNDLLSLTRPDIIRDIHIAYLEAGADIVETNTFSGTSIAQADYGLEHIIHDLNYESARLAREAADDISTPDHPRFVAGAIGPTNRTLSISPDVSNPAYRAVTFDEVVKSYVEQVRALLDGGVDILLVETVFDTLNCKAALFAIQRVFDERKRDRTGDGVRNDRRPERTHALRPDGRGVLDLDQSHAEPHQRRAELRARIRADAAVHRGALGVATVHTSLYPNAGLPNAMGGYDETPEHMARVAREYAEAGFVNFIGGCCGSTPEHIAAIAEAVRDVPPRSVPSVPGYTRLAGLEPLVIRPETNFVNIGERTNVTGSRRFARLIKEGITRKRSPLRAIRWRTARR